MNFNSNKATREQSWNYLIDKLETIYNRPEMLKAAVNSSRKDVLKDITTDFFTPKSINESIDIVLNGLKKHTIHTSHPMHFGMFNPRSNFPSILADTITASINPQLAAWSHAPFAAEVEQLLIEKLGEHFGYRPPHIFGTFTTGGQEANLTALVASLHHKFPSFGKKGLRALKGNPIIYCSEASHHATIKAAKVCGLGIDSVSLMEVDAEQRMNVKALEAKILNDIAKNSIPTMVVATLGTTGVGAIDPINEIALLAEKYDLWLHADAAYGGGIAFSKEHGHHLNGIEKADSITFDAHKWLSVPMGTSMFITTHKHILASSFSINSDYMPEEHSDRFGISPYSNSIQWSRRFMGLKLYMSFLVFGWEGYNQTINHQIEMGKLLRKKLKENDWHICNESPLPIICFTDLTIDNDEKFTSYIYNACLEAGDTWINKYPINEKWTLRACITNFATEAKHIDTLVVVLNSKREAYKDSRIPLQKPYASNL